MRRFFETVLVIDVYRAVYKHVNLGIIGREFGNYLSSLKDGQRQEESPEHLTFGGGRVNGIVQALEGDSTCFQHDEKFQELFDRQVQSNELQRDERIVLAKVVKCTAQPRAGGHPHTRGAIGEDPLASGLAKLADLRVNG